MELRQITSKSYKHSTVQCRDNSTYLVLSCLTFCHDWWIPTIRAECPSCSNSPAIACTNLVGVPDRHTALMRFGVHYTTLHRKRVISSLTTPFLVVQGQSVRVYIQCTTLMVRRASIHINLWLTHEDYCKLMGQFPRLTSWLKISHLNKWRHLRRILGEIAAKPPDKIANCFNVSSCLLT